MTPLETKQQAMRARHAKPPKKPCQRAILPEIQFLRESLQALAERGLPYHEVMDSLSICYLRAAVEAHGSKCAAARAIQMHRNTLYRSIG